MSLSGQITSLATRIGQEIKAVKTTTSPTAAVISFAGATAPTNWLLCDGTAVSRTTYAALYAIIGTTYGAGNGSTTFTLPNLKGRVITGVDAAQAEFDTLSETGGSKAAASHTHPLTSAGYACVYMGGSSINGRRVSTPSWTAQVGSAITVSASSATSVLGIQLGGDTGGGAASATDANLVPYIAMNYIIKT